MYKSVFACIGLGLILVAAGCGGGGGGGGRGGNGNPPAGNPNPAPAADPFGLTERKSLAALNLPLGGASPGTFTLQNAFPSLSFSAALFVAGVPGDDRLAVVEQGGRILAFANNSATTTTREVLNIAARVVFAGEQGLLGMAFDPAFTLNRYVYLHYIAANPRRSVIARMTWDATTDTIDQSSEKIILQVTQPYTNHNAGMLAFGPDGYLYIAMGDGGSGGDPQNYAQTMDSLLGKMLRLDVHPQNPADAYDIPPDNPFVNDAGVRPEICASGLRNPFRFSFDRQTGDLWAGDVGQGAIEEIDLIECGNNYGWRVFEGTQPFDNSVNTLPTSAFTPPVYEYDHSLGFSITGGYVYRGSRIASLVGRYLYTDFGIGTVWALEWDGNQVVSNTVLATASSPTSFGETNDAELLIVSRSNGLFELVETAGGGGQLPTQLSDTGIFDDLGALTATSGFIEYTPALPFWSDGVRKRRWVGIPDNQAVGFGADDLVFPVGTVTVKHFEVALDTDDPGTTRRLETRIFINTSSQGWQGFTYRWNANGTDATLLSGRESETLSITSAGTTRQQRYDYPSRTDCLLCHTDVAGFTLGLKTPQLNSNFDYSGVIDNQLRSWNNIDLFSQNIGAADQYTTLPGLEEVSVPAATRARAYLDVNCSNCHRSGGPTPSTLDLRFEVSDNNMNAIGATPLNGDLGISDARLIAPGDRQRSLLWVRMQRLDGERMPPLSSHVVDQSALDLIGTWIDNL